MDDLIVDSLAALAVSVVGYFSTIRRRESANSEVQTGYKKSIANQESQPGRKGCYHEGQQR